MRLFSMLRFPIKNDAGVSYLKRLVFRLNDYHKFGLYHDDVYQDELYDKAVQEAVRRLPADVYDLRNYRAIRAFQLDSEKEHLPESQWTDLEDDEKNGHYMQHIVDEVRREWKEREDWEKAHAK